MRPSLERVHFGNTSFLVFERRESLTPFWHYHPEVQLTLMVDGEGRRFIGNEIGAYGPGDLLLIGSNLPHAWQSYSASSANGRQQYVIDVQFRRGGPANSFLFTEEFRPIADLLERSTSGLSFGHTPAGRRAAERLMRLPALSHSRRAVGILDALLDLASVSDSRTLSRLAPPTGLAQQEPRGLESMSAYLTARFDQEIDFHAMSRHFCKTQAALCHSFKRETGRTMTDFITELRVNAAARLLLSSRQSLAEIAYCVGFGNYSHFNHQFKRIKGLSPRAWRRQN